LANAFADLRKKRNDSSVGIHLQLVSNQPADPDVLQLLHDLASSKKVFGSRQSDANKLRTAAGLNDDEFRESAAALDLSKTGSRFALKENILRTISSWTEGNARSLTDSLLRFIRSRMMPETKGEWITRETVLAELGFSSVHALFPCPPELRPIKNLVKRKTSSDIVDAMVAGRKYTCLHGEGGTGKTTALQEIEAQLPPGSTMLIFDCYGAGRYLDSDSYRHRPKDAFL
jgi:hypothetical protein